MIHPEAHSARRSIDVRVAVAVSGGRDSMALLHCTARAAAALGIEVAALHVHHGLQADADKWARQVEQACRRWSVRFSMRRLEGTPAPGDSVEAWARRGRYLALAAMAREVGAGTVLLAHHQQDQAETFLLQALRGAGPAGLAAMPATVERDAITWARPWLGQPAEAVAAYARRHRLRFAVDPSNADPRFARSRLRTQLLPTLRQAFPGAEAMLAESAARNAQAQALLDEIGHADLAALAADGALRLAPWRVLSPARQRNVLRLWLIRVLGRGAPQTLLERLLHELPGSATAEWPAPGMTLRRYRGRLSAAPARAACPSAAAPPQPVRIVAAGMYPMRAQAGRLHVVATQTGGVSLQVLHDAQWRARSGGERFQRAPGTPPRSLKKQFQAAGVDAWQRNAPLLFGADGRLIFVPGLGIDARMQAVAGAPQFALSWEPD
ncbi:MAG TPA: tRNA lysidine(34) synthetase TilS [Gammaproteobacteria bacterium]